MVSAITRRRLLALSAGGLAGSAGCQSLLGLESAASMQIHVLNTTDENIEVWVQLTSPEDGIDDQLGESVLMGPETVERLAVTVPTATYQLRIAVDDTTPLVEKTVQWEVTGQHCAKQSYVTLLSAETEIALQTLVQNCEQT